jgi:hypothetical protein
MQVTSTTTAVAANTLAALQGVVKNIPKKWANVQVGGCCAMVLGCVGLLRVQGC